MLRTTAQPPPDKGAPAHEDFLYEICLGDRIKQVHHPVLERVVFGTFSGWGGAGGAIVQLYSDGTVCEGFGERSATVTFLCDRKAVASPLLRSVMEPDVCKYDVTIATVHACDAAK